MQQTGRQDLSIGAPPAPAPLLTPAPEASTSLAEAVRRALENLLSLQREDGHWCGELEGDTILESEYLLLLHYLGRGGEPRASKAAEYLRRQQLPGGGWALYPGGPAEVSASVKAYFVLKLQGDDPVAPHMRRARETILGLGGVQATNTYTRTYLAVFGQVPWKDCPAIPPELMLLPRWSPFTVYDMSSWSRAIFVPLSIVWALKPHYPVPAELGIAELFAESQGGNDEAFGRRESLWRRLFFTIDQAQKLLEATGIRPLRRQALAAAESWVRERLHRSAGLGAIFPSIVNTVMALHCLGYRENDPDYRSQIEELEKLEIEEEGTLRLQPCTSPVWDTAQAASTLLAAGLRADHPALEQAARWLVEREVRQPGDWQVRVPEAEAGGWYFEYANEFYPDCDDTAEVLTALSQIETGDPDFSREQEAARRRGLAWLLSMQNDDGGWAAFDRGCTNEILTLVPFADHNAMIDPSCEDITGRVLEALSFEGFERSHPAVERAVEFLRRRQSPEGCWYGRWGVNYIYGTWLVLAGLERIGEDLSQEPWRRAVDWLKGCQNPDGGWGESLASYDEPRRKGEGESTASQTAWALLGLMAAGEAGSASVQRGIDYLLRTQKDDGSWDDLFWTGTGFPRVFYLRYHLYDDYFPLLALAVYRSRIEGT